MMFCRNRLEPVASGGLPAGPTLTSYLTETNGNVVFVTIREATFTLPASGAASVKLYQADGTTLVFDMGVMEGTPNDPAVIANMDVAVTVADTLKMKITGVVSSGDTTPTTLTATTTIAVPEGPILTVTGFTDTEVSWSVPEIPPSGPGLPSSGRMNVEIDLADSEYVMDHNYDQTTGTDSGLSPETSYLIFAITMSFDASMYLSKRSTPQPFTTTS